MSDNLARKVAGVQSRFQARLPQTHAQILALIPEESSPIAAPDLQALREIVHRLAGSAGSFGYPGISAAAEAADNEAKRLLAKPGSGAEALRAHCLALLDEMERAHAG